jgi:hypothetical protein
MYRALNPENIVATLDQLRLRIEARFPDAGLANVCAELCEIGRGARQRSIAISRPAYVLRFATFVLILAGLALLAYVASLVVTTQKTSDDLFSTIQAIDATFNIVLLTGATIFFLVKIEERMKRRRALAALNELRSIVHVIDMHQLTKDPMMLDGPTTPVSPKRDMTSFELTRYLDYCSEMLSLTAKIAALYAQSMPDEVVISTASDLTTLTTNLAAKIWQKITLVQASAKV